MTSSYRPIQRTAALVRTIQRRVSLSTGVGGSSSVGFEADFAGVCPLTSGAVSADTLARVGAIGLRHVGWTSREQLIAFGRTFGEITPIQQIDSSEVSLVQLYISHGRKPCTPEAQPPAKEGTDFWHSDTSFNARPSRATILYALSCGDGETSTDLCDAALAYETLSDVLRGKLDGLLAEHDSSHEAGTQRRSRMSRVRSVHPAVIAHPLSGRPALYVNPLYTRRLLKADGTPLPASAGQSLLDDVFAHLLKEEHRASFVWKRPGDVLVIDNTSMLHRATTIHLEEGKERRMLRVSIGGQARPSQYYWH